MSKCPSSKQRWDSNPRPFEHELSPITTIPELPPFASFFNTSTKPTKLLVFGPKEEKRSSNCSSIDDLQFLLHKYALATINLSKSPTFLGNFCIGVKSFLGNFYRHLAISSGHTGRQLHWYMRQIQYKFCNCK